MANIMQKSVKYPGLDDTYTFLQLDNTLSVAGKAADAQKTGQEIADLKSAVDDVEEKTLSDTVCKNRFDGVLKAGYVNQVTGAWSPGGTSYVGTEDMIDCGGTPFTVSVRPMANTTNLVFRYALYNASGTFIRGAIVDNSDWTYTTSPDISTQQVGYLTFTDATAKYVRFSLLAGFEYNLRIQVEHGSLPTKYQLYFDDYTEINPTTDKNGTVLKSCVVGNKGYSAKAASLADGVDLIINHEISVRKNKTYHLHTLIDSSFDTLYFGHGESSYSLYFKLDDTNITFMTNGTEGTALQHGLTLDTYVDILVAVGEKNTGTLIVNTLGGVYSHTVQVVNGYKGKVFVRPSGCSLTEVYIGFSSADFRQPVWMFGNSYFTHTSDSRWTYWLIEWGFGRCLLNAFPGMNSAEALAEFEDYIQNIAVPSVAVWCLGMNDPDASGANHDWLDSVKSFTEKCKTNGILPILATIPNVPNLNHGYKNDWVESSGYRYIDFAQAVGAKRDSTWYTGCLSDDNTHPTELGARLLCLQALVDVPELMQ